jgi:hypothetical protein
MTPSLIMDVPLGLIKESFFSHRPFIPVARILSTAYSFSSSIDQPDSVVLIREEHAELNAALRETQQVLLKILFGRRYPVATCEARSLWRLVHQLVRTRYVMETAGLAEHGEQLYSPLDGPRSEISRHTRNSTRPDMSIAVGVVALDIFTGEVMQPLS